MIILGVSAYFHDSAAVILKDGQLLYAAEEERFSRIKHDNSFPVLAIKKGLEVHALTMADIDIVVYYEKPFLKFERILESYYKLAPKGLVSFIKSMPLWLGEKLNIRANIWKSLKQLGSIDHLKKHLKFSDHHLSHAASAFYPSNFQEAAILTIDGVGEWSTATIGQGSNNDIIVLKELHYPHSVGLLYSAFTQFLGFKVNSGEYKLMGLAAYGNLDGASTQAYISIIYKELVRINNDGSIELNLKFFKFHTGLRMISIKKWEKLFGLKAPVSEEAFSAKHANLAFAIQKITEDIVIRMAKEAKRLTKSNNLCLSGGVALNCVVNGTLERTGIFKNIFIQPAAGDSGGALGAALAFHYISEGHQRNTISDEDLLRTSLAGPAIEDGEIRKLHRDYNIDNTLLEEGALMHEISNAIAEGKIIGWCQNQMEFGPRALGNRSILADPRNPKMQQMINQKVKKRESFRPFAPAILEEEASKYFEHEPCSPYMLKVYPIHSKYRKELSPDFHLYAIRDKLNAIKSEFPAITHADFSSRLQTVSLRSNPKFHALIRTFKEQTACPMLINTSFNERGEPIVQSAKDAFYAFMRNSIDILVLNNYVITKKDVRHLNPRDFIHTFKPD